MRLGLPRFEIPATSSTMDDARELALAGAREGTTVVAREQVAARGRAGRAWHAPRGGLWLSVILRPRRPAAKWSLLPLAFGTAIADYACSLGAEAGVKWPNDVVVDGRKLAGILMEARPFPVVAPGLGASVSQSHVILGIGLNVDPGCAPPEGINLTQAIGHTLAMKAVESGVMRALEARYRAFESGHDSAIMKEWSALSVTLGRTIQAAEPPVRGRAIALDEEGALVVRTGDGALVHLRAGDVREVRATTGRDDDGD